MSERPAVKRTYGKAVRPAASSSLLFPSSPKAGPSSPGRASSPPSSDYPQTPELWSSPAPTNDYGGPPSSPPFSKLPSSPTHNHFMDTLQPKHREWTSMRPSKGSEALKIGSKSSQTTLKHFFYTPHPPKRPLQPVTRSFENSLNEPDATSEPYKLFIPEEKQVVHKVKSETRTSSKSWTQMHLTHLPLFHTCKDCNMSYMRGGGEDESLHAKHHNRVMRGMPWDGLGKPQRRGQSSQVGKEAGPSVYRGWKVIREGVTLGSGKGKGKVIMCEGSFGGSKLNEISSMVDTVLSSPSLPPAILESCKIFLFVTADAPPNGKRQKVLAGDKKSTERIVSVVVAQPIKVAMRVLRSNDGRLDEGQAERKGIVDSGGGVICDPTPLPTPLGIHRLLTIPSYRGLSLAQLLLDMACSHTIYGMTVSPSKGEVAFSQPTDSGRRMMERWGGGGVRVFVDDERQL